MTELVPFERGETFTKLFVSHEKRIQGLIYALTQDRDAVDDILQDVAARLWRKFDEYEEGSNFGAWALAITRFVVLEWRRSQKRVPLFLEDDELFAIADSYVELEKPLESVRTHLDDCLAKLSERQTSLLRHLYAEGFKIVELAGVWKRSRRAIHKMLKKTKDQLLDCIENAHSKDLREGHLS
tara:strand:+ start:8278 stop:8826 length:549 start_codon:yes stop_codon:yes gene_type:complete